MRIPGWTTLVLLLLMPSGTLWASDDLTDEGVAVLLDLYAIDKVLTFALDEDEEFEPPGSWMSLRAFAGRLPEPYRDRLRAKDPWGGRYQAMQYERDLLVVSPGPDGVNDVRLALGSAAELDREAKRQISESDDVILVVGSEVAKGPPSSADAQRETLTAMRALAAAIEGVAVELNAYPAQAFELAPLAGIAGLLPTGRKREVPLTDGWGHPYLYASDGTTWVLVSPGADGVLESNPWPPGSRDVQPVQVRDSNRDIVMRDGRFLQWPTVHDHH